MSSAACVISPSKGCGVVVSAVLTVLAYCCCVINSHIFVCCCQFYSQNELSARGHELFKIKKKVNN